jgi:hypothetical protein
MRFWTVFSITLMTLQNLSCTPLNHPIKVCHLKEKDVIDAQNAWGAAIVSIGHSKNYHTVAREAVDQLYGYDLGPVLFKPTKASQKQFRETKGEAVSYFIGGQEKEDKGFARTPYVKVRFENHRIAMQCNSALAMGNYYFMQRNGKEIKVEYTFGYIEDSNGRLKINLHHSSLPYHP